ncbi:MAG: hypothetical protein MRJ92_09665 [Nitrospira sp.]|nr:hypothetical protein [Nitrospira sp.]
MGALILQMIGCLLVAATIGVMMGWLLRSFATSEKRQQLSEIATRLRGREHELDTLNHELKVRTSAVQMLEGKMITSEAALKDLTADLATKVEQLTALQTDVREKGVRLHAIERERDTLRREVEEAENKFKGQQAGFAEMQAQMENAEDVLISRDQEIATLKTWVEQLAPKDAEIARLRARTEELEPFRERSSRLEQELEQTRAQTASTLRSKEQELDRQQARIADIEAELTRLRTQNQEDLARFTETVEQRDQDIQRLRTTVEELEVFRSEVEKKEIAPARRRSDGSWMSANGRKRSPPYANDSWNIAWPSGMGPRLNRSARPTRACTATRRPDAARGNIGRRKRTISSKSMASGP